MSKIHNTAIIGKNTIIGSNVEIGPYCVVEDGVKIGNDNILHSSVYMSGETDIGNGNNFFPFCSIGSMPQDLKYQGEKSRLIIGDENIFREHCTANPGTSGDNMITIIGNSSLFMIGAHIAHDCNIGDKVIMANQATLGGHVQVDNFAVLGGLSAVHQFCRIGKLAMVCGLSAVENELAKSGGNAKARYISRRVTLEDDFDAQDIKIFLNAYKPKDTDIKVYYRVHNSEDPTSFEDRPYVIMTQETDINRISASETDVNEYVFRSSANNVAYTSGSIRYDKFKTFAIKIVLGSASTSIIPKVKDLKAVALDF